MTWDQWLFLIGVIVAFATLVGVIDTWLNKYR